MSFPSCKVQGGQSAAPAEGPDSRNSATCVQSVYGLRLPGDGSEMQGRQSTVIPYIGIGTASGQSVNRLDLTVVCSDVQGGVAVLQALVRVGAGSEQGADRLGVATFRGGEQILIGASGLSQGHYERNSGE